MCIIELICIFLDLASLAYLFVVAIFFSSYYLLKDMLSELAILSIEKRILSTIDCSDVITNFALQKA